MRYKSDESTVLCGYLTPNKTVNIKIIDTKEDAIISTSTTLCDESTCFAGLYFFNTSNITDSFDNLEIAYIMEDDAGDVYGGKAVLGGYVDNIKSKDDVDFKQTDRSHLIGLKNTDLSEIDSKIDAIPTLEQIVSGVWDSEDNELLEKINSDLNTLMDFQMGNWSIADNQMVFYKRNGELLARFDLFNKYNQPTENAVYHREKVE
jgi:hypothetical protein